MWFLILASLVASTWAAATDPACTADTADPPVKLSSTAMACEDADPAICKLVFGDAASTAAARAATCIKDDAADATKPDPNFKKLAVEKCAKHCGYCCLDPKYNCEDKPWSQTGINCTTMADKCTEITWKPVLAQSCPSTCGLCLEGGCVDKAPDCASQLTICFNINFSAWATENCARTCNQCPPSGATTSAPGVTTAGPGATTNKPAGNCVDTDVNCANWARNGKFCNNTWYKSQWSKCPQSCGKC